MQIFVDKPALKKTKDGQMLTFNVGLQPEGGGYVLLPGFRIVDGFIKPPASMYGKFQKYYPQVYMDLETAEMLYDKLVLKGWEELKKVSLREKSIAIALLPANLEITARIFPSIVKA